MSHSTILALIMAVPMVTWIGLFVYAMQIDRRLSRIERDEKDRDDL